MNRSASVPIYGLLDELATGDCWPDLNRWRLLIVRTPSRGIANPHETAPGVQRTILSVLLKWDSEFEVRKTNTKVGEVIFRATGMTCPLTLVLAYDTGKAARAVLN